MAVAARTYGRLSYEPGKDGARWLLEDIPPHVAIRLKHIFPKIPKTQQAPFILRADLATGRDLAWFLDRYPLQASNLDSVTLATARRTFEAKANEIEDLMAPDYRAPEYAGINPPFVVRPYQGQAVEMLRRSMGLLLGDEVGLGKTYVTGAACLMPGALPAIVVVQPHLQKQWAQKLREFTTLSVHLIKGTRPYTLPAADVYLFRYTQLIGWVDVFKLIKPRLVAFDEVQELRTGIGTDGEPVLKGLAAEALVDVSTFRLGLSATPIMGYGVEIWNIMRFLRPDVLGPKDDFMREWAPNGSIKDPKALGTYLREQHAFLRRTKADVGQHMPAVNKITEFIGYDEKTVRTVEELAHQLAIKATSGTFMERGQAARDLDIKLRHETGVAKARQVADFARMIVEGGSPVVLVGWHRAVYAIWLKALEDLKPAMFTGSETSGQKNAEVTRFLEGETDILIMSLRSGAGLDGLQFRASTMILGELDWSPGIHHQIIGRLDREGQKEPVTAFFLVVNRGSDPPMMEIIGLKASEAAQIVDPSLGIQAVHSDRSHLQKLVKLYLEKPGLAGPRN